MDGEEIGLVPVVSPVSAVAVIAGAPAMLGFLPLVIAGGAGWSVALALAGLALGVFAVAKHLGEKAVHSG